MLDDFDPCQVRFRELVRQWHAGHPRTDQVEHCINVAHLLEQAVQRESAPPVAHRAMILAALGHDLYEDSKIERASIAAEYGSDVDELIEAVTEHGDVTEFVERVASGPEEARLIKLCDGIDNYGGLVEHGLLQGDPAKWVEITRKQMEPMFSRLAAIPFKRYPTAGGWLRDQFTKRQERFWATVGEILRASPTATTTHDHTSEVCLSKRTPTNQASG